MKKYDVIVIGSGGGTKLVAPVTQFGKKVAIIEREKLGGTCLNRGCIPSKMLIHVADLAETAREANRFELGIDNNLNLDFDALIKRVATTIDSESDNIAPFYEKNPNIDHIHGHAKFIGPRTLEVNGEQITADKILSATGAEPAIPDIPGLKGTPFMTYRDALRPKKMPKSMIVLGGGFIAVELGYFYGALGTDVTFLVRSELVRPEDGEIKEEFTRVFSDRFKVHLKTVPESIEYVDGQFRVHIEGKVLEAEALLVTTGTVPQTAELGLENTAVKLKKNGSVIVDDHLRTDQEGVWALGDCVGNYLFRHSANFEGEYLFRTLFSDPSDEPINYNYMPYAVFTRPQIGGVGPTEEKLKADGVDYIVGKTPYRKSAMGMALMAESGLVKLIFDRKSQKLLAGHIIGEEASNMIHMVIAFIHMNATLTDMLEMIYIHPALPELVRNAARDAYRNSL